MFSFLFLQLYYLRFALKVSLDNFLLEVDYLFVNSMKSSLYAGIGILIDQKWQSAIGIEISRYSNSSSSKTTDLNSSFTVWIDNHIILGIF